MIQQGTGTPSYLYNGVCSNPVDELCCPSCGLSSADIVDDTSEIILDVSSHENNKKEKDWE